MSTRVLLLRHAESADPSVFHGAESDVGLSARGERQAMAIAPVLAAQRPNVIVSSAMLRAVRTATPIALACGLPLLQEPLLHERRVGSLAGQSTSGAENPWQSTLARWMAGDTAFAPDGAESLDDLRNRLLPVWQRWTDRHAGKTLVMVAHGMVCKVLLLSLLPGWSIADWKRLGPIHNVAITELINADGRWEAVRINELPAEVQELDG
jgi:broad specificity phosphatase PhoE